MLRKEFDAKRPAHVPDGPTHASLVAKRNAERIAARDAEAPATASSQKSGAAFGLATKGA